MDVYVALDIGGTKILAAAAGRDGKPLRTLRQPTPASLEEGLTLLSSMARECAAGATIRAIGASIGGPLDWKEGVVSPLHQPAWRSVPLKRLFEPLFILDAHRADAAVDLLDKTREHRSRSQLYERCRTLCDQTLDDVLPPDR